MTEQEIKEVIEKEILNLLQEGDGFLPQVFKRAGKSKDTRPDIQKKADNIKRLWQMLLKYHSSVEMYNQKKPVMTKISQKIVDEIGASNEAEAVKSFGFNLYGPDNSEAGAKAIWDLITDYAQGRFPQSAPDLTEAYERA